MRSFVTNNKETEQRFRFLSALMQWLDRWCFGRDVDRIGEVQSAGRERDAGDNRVLGSGRGRQHTKVRYHCAMMVLYDHAIPG